MKWHRERNWRSLFSQYGMASRSSLQMPACFGKGFNGFLAWDHRKFLGHWRLDCYFYYPSWRAHQPCSLFCQRFQTAYYCFFYVLQSLIYIISLWVASGKCWAAHYIAAFFSSASWRTTLKFMIVGCCLEAKKSFLETRIDLFDSKLAPKGPLQHSWQKRVQLAGGLRLGAHRIFVLFCMSAE